MSDCAVLVDRLLCEPSQCGKHAREYELGPSTKLWMCDTHAAALVDVWLVQNHGIGTRERVEQGRQAGVVAYMAAQRASSVYFLRSISTGLVKIGHSIDPKRRAASIASQSGATAELLLVLRDAGTRGEAVMHSRFAHLRERGEWFRAAPELLDFIDLARARQLDRVAERIEQSAWAA